ncbi:MAG: GNAT family N-acetyltransferase [Candidatus Hodarchaeota archaeon]
MTKIEEYQRNLTLRNRLMQVLEAVDQDFLPPLSNRKPLEFWMSLFEKGTILYALEEGKIAGFLAYYPSLTAEILEELRPCVNLDPVIAPTDANEHFHGAYLHFIAISPRFRGKKISSLLIRALIEDAQRIGVSKLRVVTWSTNKRSLHLYSKHGFQIFRRLPNDRAEGIASVYLELKLPFLPEIAQIHAKIPEGLGS